MCLKVLAFAGPDTLLSSLNLSNIDLNVTALLPSPSCPNGGLLNVALGLGGQCVGITAAGPNGLLQTCGLLPGSTTCCCSSGTHCCPTATFPLNHSFVMNAWDRWKSTQQLSVST